MELSNKTAIFSHQYRIYLEDTDAGGIVYHANHLKLFERCRRDWLRQLGMTSYFYNHVSADNLATSADKLHFVVSDCQLTYLRPILLDKLVTVSIETVQLRPASLILQQHIYDNDQTCLATAHLTLACVRSTNDPDVPIRSARLPQDFINLITSLN